MTLSKEEQQLYAHLLRGGGELLRGGCWGKLLGEAVEGRLLEGGCWRETVGGRLLDWQLVWVVRVLTLYVHS